MKMGRKPSREEDKACGTRGGWGRLSSCWAGMGKDFLVVGQEWGQSCPPIHTISEEKSAQLRTNFLERKRLFTGIAR